MLFIIYTMKKILRILIIIILYIFLWPFLLKTIKGNQKYQLKNKRIIIANHYSNWDAFLIKTLFIRKKIRFVTISTVKKNPMTHFLAWLFDSIYIDVESHYNLNYFKECIKELNNEGIICIFPEGIINTRGYGFFEFKTSYLLIAKKTEANILPIYLEPSKKAFKKSVMYIGEELTNEMFLKDKSIEDLNYEVLGLFMEYSTYKDN